MRAPIRRHSHAGVEGFAEAGGGENVVVVAGEGVHGGGGGAEGADEGIRAGGRDDGVMRGA